MKILIISAEVWTEQSNGGNVLSNIFDGFPGEFAQIYCNPGKPNNKICKRYYQMTDGMVIRNFFSHKPIGQEFLLEENLSKENDEIIKSKPINKKFNSFFHRYRLGIFFAIRNFLWNTSKWKNEKLKAFLDDFKPDIIFAPCYGNVFMLKLTRFVADYTKKKVISYISDDSYTLKQLRFSPYFWINRFSVRRQLRKTFPYYSLTYTMTELQKEQCERDFNAPMSILRKSAIVENVPIKVNINRPIRLVYAGGVYLNRWKTLKAIALALKKINAIEIKAVLDIYTATELSRQMKKYLNDGQNIFLHEVVSLEELKKIYANSDIALHVESFDLKNKLAVRMSFSTKIIDCLASGCAVLAVCDSKQAGLAYLSKEDAAICIDSLDALPYRLEEIVQNQNILIEYAQKARNCLEKNHNKERTLERIKKDFQTVYSEINESFTN